MLTIEELNKIYNEKKDLVAMRHHSSEAPKNCEYKRQFNALSGDYLHRKYQHNITIMPTIRFTWLNRKWVRMYSSLGMGMTIHTTNTTGSGGSTDGNSYAFAFQCSYLGLTVGRSLFGFAELGFGAKGVAIFGMGYRFNNHKKQ